MPETTVKLISMTAYPIETIYAEWLQSRTETPILTAREYHEAAKHDVKLREDIDRTFQSVMDMQHPLLEIINVTFLLEHMSIALREQIVRHRIGHRFGSQLGADIVPGGIDSTFWSQTTRVLQLDKFATKEDYIQLPKDVVARCGTIRAHNREMHVDEFYREQMKWIQSAYNRLVDAGVPLDWARMMLPIGIEHRMTWTLNLAALRHILSKRTCWVAQLGLWQPVILGMVRELATQFHTGFNKYLNPPCFKGEQWVGCQFKAENENMVTGNDPGLPCSLYVNIELPPEKRATAVRGKEAAYNARKKVQSTIWQRDPETGVRV